jgi:endoglucanase
MDDALRALLTAAGPSGYETAAAAAFRAACEPHADEVHTDHVGSTAATLKGRGQGPSVAVIGHIDEIGLIVTHIDDEGLLWFNQVGGWDPMILVGQRVEVATRGGVVAGVIGKKPIHLLSSDDRKKVPELKDLHIDIGAADGAEAREAVRIGDVAVIAAEPVELRNGRWASRSMDNRLGCYVAYETLRLLAADDERPPGDFFAVAVTQEETTFQGAYTTAYALRPDCALVIDVTHATDVPGVDEKTEGRHAFGSGPAITRGSSLSPVVYELLEQAAESEGIGYTVEATGRATGTDADAVTVTRAGVPTGVIGVPLRYMHSPVELVQLSDVAATAQLCAAFVRRLAAEQTFARG